MGKRDGKQQGPQTHAEGQHGDKTHAAFIEALHHKLPDSEALEAPKMADPDADAFGEPHPGRHRLNEDREQHDRAEKQSEANRLRG
ncbi:MAG: hypothetical protein ABJF01_08565 [bacterium]